MCLTSLPPFKNLLLALTLSLMPVRGPFVCFINQIKEDCVTKFNWNISKIAVTLLTEERKVIIRTQHIFGDFVTTIVRYGTVEGRSKLYYPSKFARHYELLRSAAAFLFLSRNAICSLEYIAVSSAVTH